MPVFQCFSPPARWPFLEFNTGATPSFPPPPPSSPSSSSSFSSSSPPHHLFSEVDDVYIASSGCSGGRLDPNPIASSGCCEGRLDRTPYRKRRMLLEGAWTRNHARENAKEKEECQNGISNICQIECQKVRQNRCQKESQIECQSICQKECQIKCQNEYLT